MMVIDIDIDNDGAEIAEIIDGAEINRDLNNVTNCRKQLQSGLIHHGNFLAENQFVDNIYTTLIINPTWRGLQLYQNNDQVRDAAIMQVTVSKSVVRVMNNNGTCGSGFVIPSLIQGNRWIITNSHVFAPGSTGFVQFEYDTVHSVGVNRAICGVIWQSEGTDDGFLTPQNLDFVVVEIENINGDDQMYPPLQYEETDRVEDLGDRPVVLFGHPHGTPKKLSTGNITGVLKQNGREVYYHHTIPSCPGSSGSPLLHLPCGRATDGTYVFALHYWGGRAVSFRCILNMIRQQVQVL
jgi:V8-like Glu-specific endopeptidase